MNVQGIGPQSAHSMGQTKRQQNLDNDAEKYQVKDKILETSDSEGSDPPVEDAGKTKGVVHNIQAGHFKGVADVRLRINFADQLPDATGKMAEEQMQEEAEALDINMAEKVDQLQQNFQFEYNFSYSFSLSVSSQQPNQQGADSLNDAQVFDIKSVVESFRKTFDDIFEELSVFGPEVHSAKTVTEADTGEGVMEQNVVDIAESHIVNFEVSEESTDDSEPEPTDFSAALNELRDFFESELQAIEERINAVLPLPPLSPPQGNGVAYDRFLGMYQDLYGLTENGSEEANSEEQDSITTSV